MDKRIDNFAVPFSVEESKELREYLSLHGLKKGHFARRAILKYMEELDVEGEAVGFGKEAHAREVV